MDRQFTRAGCYVRVSTENQLENYSIEEQSERLKAYCAAKDWGIFDFYTDGGYSGGNTERPALKKMIDDIHGNKLDLVIVYKLDRLSRSQKDTLTLIEDEFIKNNVNFVSVSENFDTSSPFGRAMIGLLSVFAQLEKDQITERFTMGRIGRSKAGRYHGGPTPPTGYHYADGELLIDDYKAIQVREVFDRFLSGYSINSIQRHMNGKYGGWTSHTLVMNVLRNTSYIGKVKFNKTEYDGIHKPIIDTDTFERAQTLLRSSDRDEQKTTSQKTPFRANYLLTSLVYCKRCGARYSGNHGYYKCYSRAKSDKNYIVDPNCKNANWEIGKLDKIIEGEIKKLRQDHSYIESLFAQKKAAPPINIESLTTRVKEIEGQISRLIDLYQVKGFSIEEISSRVDALQREKDTLKETLSKPVEDIQESKIRFISLLGVIDGVFSEKSIEEQRLFVSSVIKSIIVDGEEIQINWRI